MRWTELLLLQSGVGLLFTLGFATSTARTALEGEADPSRSPWRDEPLGTVDYVDLSHKVPEPSEQAADSIERPYHLLIRTLSWPSLEPVEFDVSQLVVNGARQIRALGPGLYMADSIGVGLSSLQITEVPEPVAPTPQELRNFKPPNTLYFKSSIPLARFAVTSCDMLILESKTLSQPVQPKGIVVDRYHREPLGDVMLLTPGGHNTVTGTDGRFEFEQEMPLEEFLSVRLDRSGYLPLTLSPLDVRSRWLSRWQESGEFFLHLRPEAPHPSLRPVAFQPPDSK